MSSNCYKHGVKLISNNAEQHNEETIEKCQILCEKTENCKNFSYNKTNKDCFLITEENKRSVDNSNFVSGPKKCQLPNNLKRSLSALIGPDAHGFLKKKDYLNKGIPEGGLLGCLISSVKPSGYNAKKIATECRELWNSTFYPLADHIKNEGCKKKACILKNGKTCNSKLFQEISGVRSNIPMTSEACKNECCNSEICATYFHSPENSNCTLFSAKNRVEPFTNENSCVGVGQYADETCIRNFDELRNKDSLIRFELKHLESKRADLQNIKDQETRMKDIISQQLGQNSQTLQNLKKDLRVKWRQNLTNFFENNKQNIANSRILVFTITAAVCLFSLIIINRVFDGNDKKHIIIISVLGGIVLVALILVLFVIKRPYNDRVHYSKNIWKNTGIQNEVWKNKIKSFNKKPWYAGSKVDSSVSQICGDVISMSELGPQYDSEYQQEIDAVQQQCVRKKRQIDNKFRGDFIERKQKLEKIITNYETLKTKLSTETTDNEINDARKQLHTLHKNEMARECIPLLKKNNIITQPEYDEIINSDESSQMKELLKNTKFAGQNFTKDIVAKNDITLNDNSVALGFKDSKQVTLNDLDIDMYCKENTPDGAVELGGVCEDNERPKFKNMNYKSMRHVYQGLTKSCRQQMYPTSEVSYT